MDEIVECSSAEPVCPGTDRDPARRPSWAHWNDSRGQRYTLGVEEEVMLLDASDGSLSQSSDWVLARLSDRLSPHTAPETHAAVIELKTGVHSDVAAAVAELTTLRAQLDRELLAMGLRAAVAGTYPLDAPRETQVAGSERYRVIANSMRALARRDPTLAMHVHVGVPDPEDAVRLLNGLRGVVPVLLALSANSPFCQGRDTGFASARTVIFQGFPRTGTARRFSHYADCVRSIDALIASGALPDPSFLWWDVRLQPALGTVEVRVMDAQTTVADDAALIALVGSLARLVLEGEWPDGSDTPEVQAENRFLAARDGLDARLIDPAGSRLVPVRMLLDELLARCRARVDEVASVELDRVGRLAAANGADRQPAWVREAGLPKLLSTLTQRFAARAARSGSTIRTEPAYHGAVH